jgi:hypothetical protein
MALSLPKTDEMARKKHKPEAIVPKLRQVDEDRPLFCDIGDDAARQRRHMLFVQDGPIGFRSDQRTGYALLCAARGLLRGEFFRSDTGTGVPNIAQFGGKINAHNPQKTGAEFRSTRPDGPQISFV